MSWGELKEGKLRRGNSDRSRRRESVRPVQQKSKCTRAASWLNGDRPLVSTLLVLVPSGGGGGRRRGRINGILASITARCVEPG